VIITAIAMPIEKNAWPSAISIVSPVTREKSGVSRNSTAAWKFPTEIEYATISNMETNSAGISTLTALSMPACRPRELMYTVSTTTTVCQKTSRSGLSIRLSNIVCERSAVMPSKAPPAARTK
jgi:hypothetical protein